MVAGDELYPLRGQPLKVTVGYGGKLSIGKMGEKTTPEDCDTRRIGMAASVLPEARFYIMLSCSSSSLWEWQVGAVNSLLPY